MTMLFEWDDKKAAQNLAKHRISFATAIHVFSDPMQLSAQDRVENGEYRWQTIGMVEGRLLLLVAHAVFDDESGAEVIRLISARKADAKERKRYEKNDHH